MIRRGTNKSIFLLLIFIFFLSSCGENERKDTFNETIDETKKETIKETEGLEIENNSYKYRGKIIELLKQEKIFQLKVDFENLENDFLLNIGISNENIELKDLDNIKVKIDVVEFMNESEDKDDKYIEDKTAIKDNKKYLEIKLKDGKLENSYDFNISKDSKYLNEEEKKLLLTKNDNIIQISIFVDEDSPVTIYNHFLN